MADSKNASFIPKKAERPVKKIRSTRRIYVLSYLSYVLFFGSLMATVGVFFYSIQISNSLSASRDALISQRDQFSSDQIAKVQQIEKKLLIANSLLNDKTAPSRIFSDIEATLANNMQLTGFKYEKDINNSSIISLTGKAREFNQLLYQRDVFNRSPIFESAVISEFDYSIGVDFGEGEEGDALTVVDLLLNDEEETITFTFMADISDSLISYQPIEISDSSSQLISVRPTAEVTTEDEDVEEASDETETDTLEETEINEGNNE